jgi:TolA-binding protein
MPRLLYRSSKLLLTGLLILYVSAGFANPVDEAVQERVEVQDLAERTQQQIDQLADETEDMVQQYRDLLRRINNARSYNEQLEAQVERQRQRILSFDRQLANVEETQRSITPLMTRMLDVLAELIELDTPFLPEERRNRLATLQDMMERPDVTLPDKFRRIMEAYQIEMDYARNIETYEGVLQQGDETLTVEYLRIGRLGLYYQTLDGQQSGYWDQARRDWVQLPTEYNHSLTQGLKIARKEAPPDFFRIPVPAPEAAQ